MSVQPNADETFRTELQPEDQPNEPKRQPVALVVDDEPLVRQLVCALLGRLGWSALEAGDGAEAQLVFDGEEISLLITDHEMPGLKGIDVADALRRRVPDLPVLVVSARPSVAEAASARGYPFLAKPFDPAELASFVSSLTAWPPTPDAAAERAPAPGGSL